MTTNLDVDLRELFVMPHIVPRPLRGEKNSAEPTATVAFMDLASARRFYEDRPIVPENGSSKKKSTAEKDHWITALDQVKRYRRNVIVGLPGAGKSTFFEWLQVKLAWVEDYGRAADNPLTFARTPIRPSKSSSRCCPY
jgi:hypothetical protein